MLFLEELDDLRLYSAKRKVYIPIDPTNRKKGAAIMLLSNDSVDSHTLMNLSYIHNPNLYESLYIDRNVGAFIDSGAIINEDEPITEAMQHIPAAKTIKIAFTSDPVSIASKKELNEVFSEKNFLKWYRFFKTPEDHICKDMTIDTYMKLSDMVNAHKKSALANKDIIIRSYCYDNRICVLDKNGYAEIASKEGNDYTKYLLNELITYVCMRTSKKCNRYLAGQVATVLSDQISDKKYEDIGNKTGEITDYALATTYVIKKLYDEQGPAAIVRLVKTGDYSILAKYASMRFVRRIKSMYESAINDIFDEEKPVVFTTPENNVAMILSSLSDDDMAKIGFNKVYIPNHPAIIDHVIRKDNDLPVGFIDVYKFEEKPFEVQLVAALNPEYRGKGYMQTMLYDYVRKPIDGHPGVTRFIWYVDPMNEKSVNLATRAGFVKTGDRRYREDLGIYEDKYVFDMPFRESEVANKIPLPVKYVNEAVQSGGHTMTDDYIMTESFITFFNGMDTQAITEAEKKYDARLKKYLYAERLKNNKAVLMRYEEMKAMNPWIKRTFLKLSQYQNRNLFIDMSFYHGLFLKNLQFNKDAAIKMYWDFMQRLMNDAEYKNNYKRITVFIPVWAEAWETKTAEELMDYRQSINPVSLIIRMLRKSPESLKKTWRDKDIVFVAPNGYFKINFDNFDIQDLTKFRRFITKLTNNENIEDDENEDGYTTVKDSDSAPVITANIIDKIESKKNIKLNDITGGVNNQDRPDEVAVLDSPLNLTHLRIRAEKIPMPKMPEDRKGFKRVKNGVLILAPNGDAAADAFTDNQLDTFFSTRGYYAP